MTQHRSAPRAFRRTLGAVTSLGLALAAAAAPGAAAAAQRGPGHGSYGRAGQTHRSGARSLPHRNYGYRRDAWSGGYYPAPPIVFVSPFTCVPPLVYGPEYGYGACE